jgi:trehalose-6-phosphate synthase
VANDAPLIGMETPSQYREFAETCDRLAGQVESEAHRASLFEMADQWRSLAEETDKREF